VRRVRVSLTIVAGLLSLGLVTPALAAGPYPPPPQGTGRVDPSRIKVGQCAVFSGDGFMPATTVTVRDNGVVRGTTLTTSAGTFSFQLCYSSESQKGRHDLAGSGTGADGAPLTVYAVLIVQGVNQSRSNPSTRSGGQAASGTTGDSATSTGATVESGSTGAVQLPPAEAPANGSTVPAGEENSGARLIILGLTGLGFAFLASLLLLLLARRRRRREDDQPLDPAWTPA
jgi:hypothetical protein